MFVVRIACTLTLPFVPFFTFYRLSPSDEQRLCLPSPDRLSNLNIYLIDDILSRLSFRDVVRVSTVSKDWQYICCRIPHVKFDQTVWKTPEDLTSPTIGSIPILDSFLKFHRGIILKVTLNIINLIVFPNVDRLIFSPTLITFNILSLNFHLFILHTGCSTSFCIVFKHPQYMFLKF